MADLSRAKRKWKKAEDGVEEAAARLEAVSGKPGADAARKLAQAKKELEDAEDEERKTKRKYRRIKAESGD